MNDNHNHDAVSTPDRRYAILALQVADAAGRMRVDGQIQLYDIENKQVVGNAVSVCAICHPEGSKVFLGGLDAVWD